MAKWIGLLRGVNVGGKNRMSMAQLIARLESIGCTDVRTYIQSGNVVFDSPVKYKATLSRKIVHVIENSFGFRADCVLLTPTQFLAAIENNPFFHAKSAPKSVHFFFLNSTPTKPDLDAMASLATDTEQYRLVAEVFYLYAPDGIGRSKLAASAEKKLGVSATARNYNTVEAISRLLASG